jgi:hypothetical protein
MQPEEQPANGGAPAPQPVQPPSQPLPQQPAPVPSNPQAPAPQVAPSQPTTSTVESLGSVAVSEQIDDAYEYDVDADEEGDDDDYEDFPEVDLTEPVNWNSKEYIHQEKDTKWFIVFAIVLIAFIAVAIFLMKSITFAVLLVVIAAAVIVLAKRPPRELEYSLSNEGLHIGDTLHKYSDFKSFGVIRDGEEFSVMLMPRRRLQPGITVYFPEEAGEDIVDALGSRLPMRELHLDIVDHLVRKLRL